MIYIYITSYNFITQYTMFFLDHLNKLSLTDAADDSFSTFA